MHRLLFIRILIFLAFFISMPEGWSASSRQTGEDSFALIPKPREIEFGGKLIVPVELEIIMPESEDIWRETLQDKGFRIAGKAGDKNNFKIQGRIIEDMSFPGYSGNEGYRMKVTPQGIEVEVKKKEGFYRALTTLCQLTSKDRKGRPGFAECEITDYPAFSYRGLMIDCGRSYLSMERLKRIIEEMGKMKLNVFHWHLTENQAWRLESTLYPQLNDSSNMTRDKGKYYTREEARELYEWGKAHGVLLIPEIDMPGHSEAFTRTFGFEMQDEAATGILKELIEEVCEIFPEAPYLHIGTDEVRFTNPGFVEEMVGFVRDQGKKAISWNPGYNYKAGEIDMTQLWSFRGKPLEGVGAVDSRFHYINHFDTYADLRALYRSDIYGEKAETEGIKGAEICLWNDRYIDDEDAILTQNNLFPSMAALAERTWLGNGTEYFDELGTNMADPGSRDFSEFEDFESRFLRYKQHELGDMKVPYVKQSNVEWMITDAFPNEGNPKKVFPPETEGLREKYVYEGEIYGSRVAYGAGIYLRHVWGDLIPGFYKKARPNSTAYAFTRVYSHKDQEVGLQFETQNYSRSEPDLPPPTGKWDYRESRLWINGDDILPPVWNNPHIERDNEVSLGNENLAARTVIPVKLRKGWNEVMIKLPVGEFSTPDTRLVKWMFTCVFTTADGREAAPGLIYQPLRKIKN